MFFCPAANRYTGLVITQLVLNALWSWLFFAGQRGVFAEIEIVVLLAMIL
jgi:tryptophan-rich sensory protein